MVFHKSQQRHRGKIWNWTFGFLTTSQNIKHFLQTKQISILLHGFLLICIYSNCNSRICWPIQLENGLKFIIWNSCARDQCPVKGGELFITDSRRLFCSIFLCFPPSICPSVLTRCPVFAEVKHSHMVWTTSSVSSAWNQILHFNWVTLMLSYCRSALMCFFFSHGFFIATLSIHPLVCRVVNIVDWRTLTFSLRHWIWLWFSVSLSSQVLVWVCTTLVQVITG